jgi:hypothetical protein
MNKEEITVLKPGIILILLILNVLYWYEIVYKFIIRKLLNSLQVNEIILLAILLVIMIILGFYIAILSIFIGVSLNESDMD